MHTVESLLGHFKADPPESLSSHFWVTFIILGFWAFQEGINFTLEDRNLLKLRSLVSSCSFFLSDNSIWGQ